VVLFGTMLLVWLKKPRLHAQMLSLHVPYVHTSAQEVMAGSELEAEEGLLIGDGYWRWILAMNIGDGYWRWILAMDIGDGSDLAERVIR
jgi:hypothetical protein